MAPGEKSELSATGLTSPLWARCATWVNAEKYPLTAMGGNVVDGVADAGDLDETVSRLPDEVQVALADVAGVTWPSSQGARFMSAATSGDHLPKTEQSRIDRRLAEAFNHPDTDQGLAKARALATEVAKTCPDAAGSIRKAPKRCSPSDVSVSKRPCCGR